VAVLLVWCGLLFFYGIGGSELWRTESLRAIIGREFLQSGNWVVPTLYGEPLYTKPPGMYALIALCSAPFGGVTEWTARLPAALAATLTVLLFFWYFGRELGRRAGLVAALVLPMSLLWLDKASAAEIDMVQVAWVSAAILFLLRALDGERSRIEDRGSRIEQYRVRVADSRMPTAGRAVVDPRSSILDPRSSWPWWLAALGCVAGGFLTKWTAPAFFYATAVTLLWRRGQLRLLWRPPHLVSAGLAAAVCLAWVAAAVALTGWDVFESTVRREAMQRIVPTYADRSYPWHEVLLHPLLIWGAALPGSLAAALALWPGFAKLWDERGRRLLQALHCWIWPNVVIWSLMSEHTPRHSFPLLPGIAGLTALVWVAWLDGRLRWWPPRPRPVTVFVLLLVCWLGVKGAFVHAVTPQRNGNREPRAKGQLLAHLVPPGFVLYLFKLKDEGIMFYYGRSVLRLDSPADLPSSGEPVYCILEATELEQWSVPRRAEVLRRLTDEQGAPIVLVRVLPARPPTREAP
jgi:4-amino-4-deoxy-L-arabinose transferase-like glycosyltransferase